MVQNIIQPTQTFKRRYILSQETNTPHVVLNRWIVDGVVCGA